MLLHQRVSGKGCKWGCVVLFETAVSADTALFDLCRLLFAFLCFLFAVLVLFSANKMTKMMMMMMMMTIEAFVLVLFANNYGLNR